MFAEIIFPVSGKIRKALLEGRVPLGARVLAPKGRGYQVGIVFKELLEAEDLLPGDPPLPILDDRPIIPSGLWSFLKWVSWYYQAPLTKVIKTALPSPLLRAPSAKVALSEEGKALLPEGLPLVVGLKRAGKRGLSLETIKRNYGEESLKLTKEWLKKGLLQEVIKKPSRSSSALSILEPEDLNRVKITPSKSQKTALEAIVKGLKKGYQPFLLHGITGSGKTWIYIEAAREVLAQGKKVLVLVPEIALIGAIEAAFVAEFGQDVALLHSFLPPKERSESWIKAAQGGYPIIIGARSAIFAPLEDIGLIIIDEEHDPSYKQEEGLRYQARDLALARGKLTKAGVILGSATPSIKSYYLARKGRLRLLSLKERPSGSRLPRVHLIDLTRVKKVGYLISSPLIEAIEKRLKLQEQVILFINRRGFATLVACQRCGYQFRCLNCSVALTYHKEEGVLRCHYCGLALKALPQCPACGQGRLEILGLGTERVVEEIRRLLPQARVERLDRDLARNPRRLQTVLKAFGQREVDILVGTQMISKGHHFPGVTLVGVILADLSLNFPDFKAPEKTFQLLVQVAGRSGRASTGEVIIQSFNPGHYSLRYALRHDYQGFYETEISLREELNWPPFSRLASLIWESTSAEAGEKVARALEALSSQVPPEVEILGPAATSRPRLKGRWRWQVILKAASVVALHQGLAKAQELARKAGRGHPLRLIVDIDPEDS
ncbi:replication restart helicase PriA [Thermosulfuriphilus sp.]